MSHFIRNGNMYSVMSEEAMDLHPTLPVGNYTVKRNEMTGQFFLEMVDSFPQVPKLYGDTTRHADRILNTFFDRPNSTGIMLNGEKGSGKTLLAKTLSINAGLQGVPTIIINAAWTGDAFNKFMQDIEQPCIILFDEFEKVYAAEDQEAALTLLDGVFPSRKLFILTCNDKWRVNEHMRNRPGRIFYMIDFKGLDAGFIREYCEEQLKAVHYIDKIVEIASLFEQFNFDMLKALVEEMNRYGETPQDALKMLNAKPEFNNNGEFTCKLLIDGVEVEDTRSKWTGNPLNGAVHFEYDTDKEGDDPDTWHNVVFTPNNIVKVDASEGRFVYQNEKNEVAILTRAKSTGYNYLAL
jgi:hypothetical protein